MIILGHTTIFTRHKDGRFYFHRAIRAMLIASTLFGILGCGGTPVDLNETDGVEVSFIFGDIINGVAYDRAKLNSKLAESYVFPDNALIQVSADLKHIELFIGKVLHCVGHPPDPLSVYDARKAMGLAYQVVDKEVVVATYGEWGSRIEGGAYIHFVARIPENINYKSRAGLSGAESIAAGERDRLSDTESDLIWYASSEPRDGWVALNSGPDPAMTLKQWENK